MSYKELILCGNKKCNHIATNKDIMKLQMKHLKKISEDCKNSNNKPKCAKIYNKQNPKPKFKILYDKKEKCISKHCKKKKTKFHDNLFGNSKKIKKSKKLKKKK
tara:strand:- start:891 stop:1202 length:312 start_codon:yes stop_codon:yes gene_type:complete